MYIAPVSTPPRPATTAGTHAVADDHAHDAARAGGVADARHPDGRAGTDVHQHLWPDALVEALRRRSSPPMLRGWTLHLRGEPAFEVAPGDHDAGLRAERELVAGRARVLVSLSTPLGIEELPAGQAEPLLEAWHEGAAALPRPFGHWAALRTPAPGEPHDLAALDRAAASGAAGLQVGAHLLSSPHTLERHAPLLERCTALGLPVLVHPGPVAAVAGAPAWWPAVAQYPAQLQAAWWAWTAVGRSLLPGLRIAFAAGAGLAPVHHERLAARGGPRRAVDPDVFVDTSSYGHQGIDALVRALGIDAVVLASDRPYAEPADEAVGTQLGEAALHAIAHTNPARLLGHPTGGATP